MSEPWDLSVIAVLVAALIGLILPLHRALERPTEDIGDSIADTADHPDEDYRALAKKDRIPPDVAGAFEEEIRIRGRDIRRKHEEKRRREFEDRFGGYDVDPI